MERKILAILMISVFIFSTITTIAIANGEEDNIITKTVIFSQPTIVEKENFVTIEISEANSNYWETDKPLLPVFSQEFVFDFGTTIDSVEVTFSDTILQKVSKPIEPASESYKISSIKMQNNILSSKEISYDELGVYPEKQFSYKTAAGKNGKENVIFCGVSLNPIQYNAEENTISYSQSAEIKIKYTPPTNRKKFPDEYDLLILTPSEFESALQRLANHKNKRDIKTKLVTLDEIPSQGIDEQESIKLFIKDAIETWGVDYLTIVGSGIPGEAKFPFRYAWIGDDYEDFFPSDLYYADIYDINMNFSDWDYDDDGKYAEYEHDIPYMDIVPDIYLGRIPCDSVSELNAYIDKVIWYDEHNKMTNRIILVGGDSTSLDGEGIYEGEFANQEVLKKLPGYKGTKLWASQWKVTKLNIAIGFELYPDFIDFSGHGCYKSWATHPPEKDNIWVPINTTLSPNAGWRYDDFENYFIKNPEKYPIVFSCACSNNKFTKSKECLSWKTISHPNGGGIIAFGASGIAKVYIGTQIVERLIGWMEVHAFDELYKTKNLGEVWSNCVKDYYTTFEETLGKSDYKTMLILSMFGDPTLFAQEGDDPKDKVVIIPLYKLIERIFNQFPLLEKILRLL